MPLTSEWKRQTRTARIVSQQSGCLSAMGDLLEFHRPRASDRRATLNGFRTIIGKSIGRSTGTMDNHSEGNSTAGDPTRLLPVFRLAGIRVSRGRSMLKFMLRFHASVAIVRIDEFKAGQSSSACARSWHCRLALTWRTSAPPHQQRQDAEKTSTPIDQRGRRANSYGE